MIDKQEHQGWKRAVFLLALCIGGTSASYTMLVPFLPLYLLELGAPQDQVTLYAGVVFSVTFLIAAIMAPIWGKMADKRGKRPMAIRACVGLTAAYFLGGIVTSPLQLFGMRVVQGFANGFLPAVLAIASVRAPANKLGYALGIVQTGQIIGTVLGPLLGGIISELVGMRMSFFVASGFLLLVTIFVFFFVKEPPRQEKMVKKAVETSILEDFRYAAHNHLLVGMLLLAMVINLANMVLQPVISLYIAELQSSMENVAFTSGLIFSLGGIAGALSTAFWGTMGQRRGYFLVMVVAFGVGGLFNAMQYLAPGIASFAVLQFLFGLFFVGANPAVSATLAGSTDAGFRGRAFGLMTTANQFGGMAGPLLGSGIATLLGIKFVFLVTGPCLMLIGGFIWYRCLHQRTTA